jgi:hypothetical protein
VYFTVPPSRTQSQPFFRVFGARLAGGDDRAHVDGVEARPGGREVRDRRGQRVRLRAEARGPEEIGTADPEHLHAGGHERGRQEAEAGLAGADGRRDLLGLHADGDVVGHGLARDGERVEPAGDGDATAGELLRDLRGRHAHPQVAHVGDEGKGEAAEARGG